jgi:predicted secreted protein
MDPVHLKQGTDMISQRPPLNPGYVFATVLACLALAFPVLAQNQYNLNSLDPGQLILNLSATEQTNVEQDTLNVFMQYTAQGRDSTALQGEVNKALRNALDILKQTDNIDYAIQQYRVFMVQDGRPTRNDVNNPVWRAQQGVQMNSMNSEALLVVTARLQQAGLVINDMHYSLSSGKFEEVSDSLMNAALKKLQARADEAAATLGKGRADLVEVSLNGGQNFFGPRPMMAMDTRASGGEAMPVPVAEPGESQVNMTVSARALLSP